MIKTLSAQVETKLIASDGEAGDFFGRSVAIEGETIIVGASDDDNVKGIDAGSAYVFRKVDDAWVETQKLIASEIADKAFFGYDVEIDGDYAVITACWSDDLGEKTGSAYIFRLEGSEWYEEMKLLASDGDTLDNFGLSVDIELNHIVVGARQDDDMGVNSGAVYVYQLESTSATDLPAEIRPAPKLMQNYPNPFSAFTRIEYMIERDEHVNLLIYNSLGQVVRTLSRTYQPAGRYIVTWDGRDENGFRLTSGEYYFQLFVGENMVSKKAMLME